MIISSGIEDGSRRMVADERYDGGKVNARYTTMEDIRHGQQRQQKDRAAAQHAEEVAEVVGISVAIYLNLFVVAFL